jgi:hypothetical protein
MAVMVAPYFERSLIRQILPMGREALLVEASGIAYDETLFRVLLLTLALGALFLFTLGPSIPCGTNEPRWMSWAKEMILVLGAPLGVGLSWIALRGVAQLLTGGEMRYAGMKLAYGFVAVAALIALSALLGISVRWHPAAVAAILSLLLYTVTNSATVALADDWAERAAIREPTYAVNVIRALERTSVDLPIRCLPAPGLKVTPRSRWAAYFCIRWMEDAFNVARFHGYGNAFLRAEGPTFEAEVTEALLDRRYEFAYRISVEPGWYGWDGG